MDRARVCFVVAAGENGVIGRTGKLPWRMPGDLRLFRRLTMGKPVIMGRKTFQSIGKPLDGRDNIVLTRDGSFARGSGTLLFHDLQAALTEARRLAAVRGADEIAVIGGSEVFRESLPFADRIYLTRVHASPAGDTFLPPLDPADWLEISRRPVERHEKNDYDATLIVLDRLRPARS
jgi:dihydrofolate reductase